MQAVTKQCGNVVQAVLGRMNALHLQSTKTCAQAVSN